MDGLGYSSSPVAFYVLVICGLPTATQFSWLDLGIEGDSVGVFKKKKRV